MHRSVCYHLHISSARCKLNFVDQTGAVQWLPPSSVYRNLTYGGRIGQAQTNVLMASNAVNHQAQHHQPLAVQHHSQHQHAVPRNQYSSRAVSLARALHLDPSQTAAMMREYPALTNFNHARLADKLQEMAGILQVSPWQLTAVLVQKPRVLGASLQTIESRVDTLVRIFGDLGAVQHLVMQDPSWLTWNPKHLHKRLHDMATCLGLQQQQLLQLLQQHPQLLDASRWLVHSLRLIQQLLLLAAKQSAATTAATPPAEHFKAAHGHVTASQGAALSTTFDPQMRSQPQAMHSEGVSAQKLEHVSDQQSFMIQQQQQSHTPWAAAPVSVAEVRAFAVQHAGLLLVPPDDVLAHIVTMQAQSGLSQPEVAAAVLANPDLLLLLLNSSSTNGSSNTLAGIAPTGANQRSSSSGGGGTTGSNRISNSRGSVSRQSQVTTDHTQQPASFDHSNSNYHVTRRRRHVAKHL